MNAEISLQLALDLRELREPAGSKLRKYLFAVNTDFKTASICRDQNEALHTSFQLFHKLFGQTGRFRLVISNLAIDDLNFHEPS